MTNQQFIQNAVNQNAVNQNATNIHPANRFYDFNDLPGTVQEKLRRLQNTAGDYLKINKGGAVSRMVFLILLAFLFIIFIALVSSVGITMNSFLILSTGGLMFSMWTGYLAWRVVKTSRAPLTNSIYLTPTQLIEVIDGNVRYRELKDVVEFHHLKVNGKSGSNNYLKLRFSDNDCYEYPFLIGLFESHEAEAVMWQATAAMWRDYALNAFQREDAAFFNSWNIFQGMANVPVRKRKSHLMLVLGMLFATLLLPVIGFFCIYLRC